MSIEDEYQRPISPPTQWANAQSPPADGDDGDRDRDRDNWLGCESLHPLTWLPADSVDAIDAIP